MNKGGTGGPGRCTSPSHLSLFQTFKKIIIKLCPWRIEASAPPGAGVPGTGDAPNEGAVHSDLLQEQYGS